MARYRKIDVRIWGDERFRALSPPLPSGQFLWFYLLTGPQTTVIPGLFSAGEAGMAEAIGWPLKGFREAFAEASSKGMAKADWFNRLVWVPKAINYNTPESPNVIRNWRSTWDELPECALKLEAFQHLKAFTEGLSQGFRQAFSEALREVRAQASRNQEQEQEQEQDQRLSSAGADARARVDWFVQSWNRLALPEYGKVQKLTDGRRKKATASLGGLTDPQVETAIANLNAWPWRGKDGSWRPSFDYLLQDDNLVKFAEGAKGGAAAPARRSLPEDRPPEAPRCRKIPGAHCVLYEGHDAPCYEGEDPSAIPLA